MKNIPWICLPAPLLALCLFAPVIGFEYVWDDVHLFLNSDALRSWPRAVFGIFEPVIADSAYLRPLVLLSFATEFSLAGLDSGVSHGINLALHLGNTLLVGLLAHALTRSAAMEDVAIRTRVILAGLIYGLHPAMIEPVAWVSSRFDLMCAFFILLALLVEVRVVRWRAPLIALCFLAAALSKEMAATFPLLLFLFQRISRWQSLGWRELPREFAAQGEWRVYALLLFTGLAYVVLRWHSLGHLGGSDLTTLRELSARWWLHAGVVALTFLFYLRTAFWPFADVSTLHPFVPSQVTPTQGFAALAALALCLAPLLLGSARRSRPLTLLLIAAIALLPVLNLLPLRINGSIGHERFLVLPLAFVALALALLPSPSRWPGVRTQLLPRFIQGLAALWLCVAVANVRVTLPLWSNELSLWQWTYQKHPDHWYSRHIYAAALIGSGRHAQAGALFEEWLARGPLEMQVQVVYASYLYQTRQYREAVNYLRGVIDLVPPHRTLSPQQLAQLPLPTPVMAASYRILAHAYTDLREPEQALAAAEEALRYEPDEPANLMMLALALYAMDRTDEARDWEARARERFLPEKRASIEPTREGFIALLCQGAGRKPVRLCREFAAKP